VVKQGDSKYYFMGYLPSDAEVSFVPQKKTPTTEEEKTNLMVKEKLLTDQSMVLRYRQTGKKDEKVTAGDEYSEIGFFHQPTSWVTKKWADYEHNLTADMDKDQKEIVTDGYVIMKDGTGVAAKDEKGNAILKGADGNLVVKDATGTVTPLYPSIDQVRIKSTGDIRSEAVNYHEIKAKRLEFLAGLESRDHTNTDELPLGDNPGDDSTLAGGDMHFRAKKRVVIKADKEIRLQVGRTVLTLSDKGFNVTSKITNSNFVNLYDAKIGLSPRGGVSMFGDKVRISAGSAFQLGDNFGGAISSNIGVVGINGRNVTLQCYNELEYSLLIGASVFQFVQSIASAGLAADDRKDFEVADYLEFAEGLIESLIKMVKPFTKLRKDFKKEWPSKAP
jgi:hypothetical protein